ncbi:MAG TPA: Gfo/Idh/MocA family oxidoreductase, partial [Niabella sp.]
RKRGRIVLVGVIGLDIKRADFYKKELSFQVSCSYGPGRYDEEYEQKGVDYPLAFVRWTEKRNFETVLQAISKKQINVLNLITERVALKNYLDIYGSMGKGSIASILEYSATADVEKSVVAIKKNNDRPSNGVIGIIGAGNFTKMTVMPALKNAGAYYKYIASAGGLTAKSLAKKYGFEFSTTDYKTILQDHDVDLVMITTRHDLHASMVVESLKSGKHVFVEKPLALNNAELNNIVEAYQSPDTHRSVTVGFNRRFSPYAIKARQLIGAGADNLNMIATMNAGFIPPDVWVQDIKTGGGRIIGEACHFIDLMVFLTGSKVEKVIMSALGKHPSENSDNTIITLCFVNGAHGVINYFANGSKAYPKERIELFSQGRTLVIDNFRKMQGYGFKGFSSYSNGLDKGHKTQFKLLIDAVKTGGTPIIPFEELVNTTKTSFAAIESMHSGRWINID